MLREGISNFQKKKLFKCKNKKNWMGGLGGGCHQKVSTITLCFIILLCDVTRLILCKLEIKLTLHAAIDKYRLININAHLEVLFIKVSGSYNIFIIFYSTIYKHCILGFSVCPMYDKRLNR